MKNLIEIPRITDPRGNLAVIEKEVLPYAIKRVYYLHDVPSGAYRGGHAHKECKELLIAVSGSFEVVLDNGNTKERIMLSKPNQGLLIDVNIWRELENFSSGAVCLVLASHEYDEDDYIRNYETYKSLKS
ncbi:sugar 3,4-ketoisomerase [Dokdonia donghaensis]|uniref:WxcM domain-containing protein n=1 Tax=Dokdonia donghaensis DSW-1 TaxID=1300343 RepID=A0A0A2GWX5_9FLAO|nr:FdtA/QdtA family cupin domain-containing protein [Dokdonia donghaensis]ANH60476.1 TDP-4-oxo-6-deoxy-alpha-D-glucose-3,4-oxoisomerase [Dokdonia donghaensis DSW-1]KGO07737.1 WxcM domain-containing protein [Dokdonia donghaensis DSW-1]